MNEQQTPPGEPGQTDNQQDPTLVLDLCTSIGSYLNSTRRLIAMLEDANQAFAEINGYSTLYAGLEIMERVNERMLHTFGRCISDYVTTVYYIPTQGSLSREQIEEHVRRAGINIGASSIIDLGGGDYEQRP